MTIYDLAVKNNNPFDCRSFIDRDSAMAVLSRRSDIHYEQRIGHLVKYFIKGEMKTTVFSGDTPEDIIRLNESAVKELIRRDYDCPDARINVNNLALEYDDKLEAVVGIFTAEIVEAERLIINMRIVFLDSLNVSLLL